MTQSFDFGDNWREFSANKVDPGRLDAAIASLRATLGPEGIRGRSFLDVGCGSGLFSIAATRLGAADVVAFDLSPRSIIASRENQQRLAPDLNPATGPRFVEGDILDDAFAEGLGTFDVVYAWGSLHHTGRMWSAIDGAAARVADPGTLVLAIYNAHWSSSAWKQVKRLYNRAPRPFQLLMRYAFGAAIYIGLWLSTGQNPTRKERGMDFWYDVIDWLGGYPYEYARVGEIEEHLGRRGLRLEQLRRPRTGTGCNEYVFRRRSA